jgi:hypothetical protein
LGFALSDGLKVIKVKDRIPPNKKDAVHKKTITEYTKKLVSPSMGPLVVLFLLAILYRKALTIDTTIKISTGYLVSAVIHTSKWFITLTINPTVDIVDLNSDEQIIANSQSSTKNYA